MSAALPAFEAALWPWAARPNWVFLTLDPALVDAVRLGAMMAPRGWGSVRVEAEIEGIRWQTSLFPERSTGLYVLPVKAAVRRRLGVAAGDRVTVCLKLLDAVLP